MTDKQKKINYKNYVDSRTDPQLFDRENPLLTFDQFIESLEADKSASN